MVRRIYCAAALLMVAAIALAQGTGTVREIEVRGNQRVSKEAILAAMQTQVGQPYVQATLEQDQLAIEGLGFFQAVDVRAEPLAEGWRIIVDVSEFPVIKEIRIVGNEAVSTEEIMEALTLEPGDVFNQQAVTPSIAGIQRVYTDKGFFAEVDAFRMLEESPGTLQVSIVELIVNTVGIEGNRRTREEILRRLIRTRPGEPFSRDLWRRDLSRLLSTGWFSGVDSDLEFPSAGLVDATAVVVEQPTGTFNVGVSIDPRSSFAGFVRVSDTNFQGTGQTIGLNVAQTSRGGGTSVDIDYTNPFFGPRDTTLSASVYSRVLYRFTNTGFGSDDTPTEDDRYVERRTGGALGVSRAVSDTEYVSIAGRFESIDTQDLDTTANTAFIQQDGDLTTLTLGYTKNMRDVDIDPSSGYWFRGTVEPGFANIKRIGGAISDPDLLGRSTYVKSAIDYRVYFTPDPPRTLEDVGGARRVLAGRLQAGTITGDVPFFEQFFIGGSNSLRGYEQDRFWGKNMLQATLEYRHPIQTSLSLIGFVDYGGAWGGYGTVGDFIQTDDLELKLGYGVGVGVRIPGLGTIRLDLGFNEDGESRTHFILGSSF